MKNKYLRKILGCSFLAIAFCLFGPICSNSAIAISGTATAYRPYQWTLEDGVLSFSCERETNCIIYPASYFGSSTWGGHKAEVRKIIIDNRFDEIYSNAFRDFPNLEEVVFPKSMGGQIADYAFYNCPKLKTVKLPEGIMRVGKYAFHDTGITSVEIPIYLDWIDEHAFNDNTEVVRLKEKEGIIAAGTAGDYVAASQMDGISGEGSSSNDTCYNKSYFGRYYDDTAFWRIDNEGTLTIWGKELHSGFQNSRNPWGCYEEQIKKVIFNDDKTGKLTKRNRVGSHEALSNAKYAIYTSKPVEEIMDGRIKELKDAALWDCRAAKCSGGFKNIETVVVNRGVETIRNRVLNQQGYPSKPSNIYISKYVKNVGGDQFYVFASGEAVHDQTVHLEVSYEDYVNNGYNYAALTDDNGFKKQMDKYLAYGTAFTECNGLYRKCASISNNIDDYYVSINDTSAPATITYKGKTLYKYETYITKDDGSVDVSLPNMDDVDYYVKEIKAPTGFQLDKNVYKVDMSGKNIDIQVADYPIGYKDPKTIENPETATTQPAVYFMLFGALAAGIALTVRRIVIVTKGN